MIRGRFDQAKCQGCYSWHFAIQLSPDMKVVEFKCCKCGRIIKPDLYMRT